MQADAEHQQHDADFGQLSGQVDIGDEAGCRRADHHPGQQVADQWRHAQAGGDEAEDQRQPEGGGDGGDEAEVMGHLGGGMIGVLSDHDGEQPFRRPENNPFQAVDRNSQRRNLRK